MRRSLCSDALVRALPALLLRCRPVKNASSTACPLHTPGRGSMHVSYPSGPLRRGMCCVAAPNAPRSALHACKPSDVGLGSEERIVGSTSEIHSLCRPRPLCPARPIRAALPFAPRRSAQLARRRQSGLRCPAARQAPPSLPLSAARRSTDPCMGLALVRSDDDGDHVRNSARARRRWLTLALHLTSPHRRIAALSVHPHSRTATLQPRTGADRGTEVSEFDCVGAWRACAL